MLIGEVHRQRYVAHQDHVIPILAFELNEDVLSWKTIVASRGHDRVGDPIYSNYRDPFSLRMERVGHVHVRHDLVARLDQIIAPLIGLDLYQAEVGFRVDEPGIHGHATGINHHRSAGNRGARSAYSSDFAVLHHYHSVFDHTVSDG